MRFVGSGVDASVALSPVQSGDVVSVLVGVAGATATVQSESRNAGGKVELEGRVESLPPTQAAETLVVAGRTVKTTAGVTVIRDGNDVTKAFTDLAVGQRVHVKGTLVTARCGHRRRQHRHPEHERRDPGERQWRRFEN